MTTLPTPAATTTVPPEVSLMQLMFGGIIQKSIFVAAKLNIADLLAQQPQTAAELAAKTNMHEHALFRVLRALASFGIFTQNTEGRFELTPMASFLRSDHSPSLRDMALLTGEDWIWNNWGAILHTVQTGKTAQEKVHGMGIFDYLSTHPESGEVFNRAMTSRSQLAVPSIVQGYDFSAFGKIVDVAGGHGLLLAGILKAHPQVRGVLFDLPSVISGASPWLEKEGVANRVELVAGDFFQSVPEGADAYLMKHIIHDWDDDHCLQILQNISQAMKKNGKLLIVEVVVPKGNGPSPAKILDLQMLISVGGKERTEEEYEKLLSAAGFQLTHIFTTNSPLNIIEGKLL